MCIQKYLTNPLTKISTQNMRMFFATKIREDVGGWLIKVQAEILSKF